MGLFRILKEEARDWCNGKLWIARLPFLIWLAYVLIRHLADSSYNSILGPLNLGIHELGHFVFNLFGKFLGVAGGTVLECLAPIFAMVNFYKQKDFFAISLSFGWLSTCLFDVSRYVSDARGMELPLVTPFGADYVIHDWNYLLTSSGLLNFDLVIGFVFKIMAVVVMLVGLILGSWLLWQMKKTKTVESIKI